MAYQNVLPFDEDFAWFNLIKNLKRLTQGQQIVYYGIAGRKIRFKCLFKDRYLVTSYNIKAIKFNIEYEKGLSFREVEFMSTVLKSVDRHVCSYKKSLTKNNDWKKQVYRCTDPDCHSYSQAQFIVNKRVKCTKCGNLTIADYEQIRHRNRNLTCLECSKSTKKETVRLVNDEVSRLFENVESEEEMKDDQ